MTDNEALIPRIKAILAETRATSAESFQLQRLVVDYTERTVTSNDRERIAELERDLNALRELFSERDEMYRASVAERDELRHNLAQNAAITETLRAELHVVEAENKRMRSAIVNDNDREDYLRAEAQNLIQGTRDRPVVEEEQGPGPWVVIRRDGKFGCELGGDGWTSNAEEAFVYKLLGLAMSDASATFGERVITLAEAHRIAGAK